MQIEEFIQKVFSNELGRENVVWFKNYRALQSIPSLEHIHVFVRGASEGVLTRLLEGPWGTQGERVKRLNYREKQGKDGLLERAPPTKADSLGACAEYRC